MSPNVSPRTDVFHAIGDPNRRRILELLSDGTRSVGELAAQLGIAQPSVTQHLAVLSAVHAVESTKVGNRSMYRLTAVGATEAFGDVIRWIRALDD